MARLRDLLAAGIVLVSSSACAQNIATVLASPPPIGSTAANLANFTVVCLHPYHFATLPSPTGVGTVAYIDDATSGSCVKGTTIVGGSTVGCMVLWNGSVWVGA